MSCGPIKENQIQEIMPYDGETAHPEATMSPDKEIVSLKSTTRFVWNQVMRMWQSSKKRKRAVTAANENSDSDSSSDEINSASTSASASKKRVSTTSGQSVY